MFGQIKNAFFIVDKNDCATTVIDIWVVSSQIRMKFSDKSFGNRSEIRIGNSEKKLKFAFSFFFKFPDAIQNVTKIIIFMSTLI